MYVQFCMRAREVKLRLWCWSPPLGFQFQLCLLFLWRKQLTHECSIWECIRWPEYQAPTLSWDTSVESWLLVSASLKPATMAMCDVNQQMRVLAHSFSLLPTPLSPCLSLILFLKCTNKSLKDYVESSNTVIYWFNINLIYTIPFHKALVRLWSSSNDEFPWHRIFYYDLINHWGKAAYLDHVYRKSVLHTDKLTCSLTHSCLTRSMWSSPPQPCAYNLSIFSRHEEWPNVKKEKKIAKESYALEGIRRDGIVAE